MHLYPRSDKRKYETSTLMIVIEEVMRSQDLGERKRSEVEEKNRSSVR